MQIDRDQHQLSDNETDTMLLWAHTATGYANYPWYLNLTMSRHAGHVLITARLPTPDGKAAGSTSCVRFTREMWREFMEAVEAADKRFKAADDLDSIL